MNQDRFIISQKITGGERKTIAAVVSDQVGKPVRYAGTPSYAFEIGGWTLDKDSVLHSPPIDDAGLQRVFSALMAAGYHAEGFAALTVSKAGIKPATLLVMGNIIRGKQSLLQRALGTETELIVMENGNGISFPFFMATLDAEEWRANITLARMLILRARALKFASPKERPVENDKYAMRVFLMRLGFMGDAFKAERRYLLSRLGGNAAYRTVANADASIESEVE